MNAHRRISYILGACAVAAVALTITACGSSAPSTPPATTTPPATSAAPSPTPSGEPTTGADAQAAIKSNWEAFFSPKTSVGTRVGLLQDGSQFQQIIQSQAGSSLASGASAKVTNVTVNSPTQATVKYDVLINGQPALSNQTGTAVYENGTWKVGVASFCGLLTLENGGKTTGLPAACAGG